MLQAVDDGVDYGVVEAVKAFGGRFNTLEMTPEMLDAFRYQIARNA
jgi:hypothetical protein